MNPRSRRHRPAADVRLEGDVVVVEVRGRLRKLLAFRRGVVVPLAHVVRVAPDPTARARIPVSLRHPRRHHHGVYRLGTYHGRLGWSFWAIGVGEQGLCLELTGERLRFVVVEVADAAATSAAIAGALAARRSEGAAR